MKNGGVLLDMMKKTILPIKCKDPLSRDKICRAHRPHPKTGHCVFEINGFCGADDQDWFDNFIRNISKEQQ